MMTGYNLGQPFVLAANITNHLNNWYAEQSFRLFCLSQSNPKELTGLLPLPRSIGEPLAEWVGRARDNFLNSATTAAANGNHAKPSMGNVMAGFQAQMQRSFRPALEILMRTGLDSPLKLLLVGTVAIAALDYATGSHLRDGLIQAWASLYTSAQRPKTVEAETPETGHSTSGRGSPHSLLKFIPA